MRGTTWGAVAVALALAAGCSGTSGGESSDSGAGGATTEPTTGAEAVSADSARAEAYQGEDFYAEPSPLPEGGHGTLIRYQRMEGAAAEGATAWRIMYLSEDVAGDPIAVTGAAVVPDAAAPDGGRPVLAIAHGTTGIADECAPSKNPADRGAGALAAGTDYLVVTSDYEGLGTAGRHPYLVGESEGRGVLDAVRAAAALPDADAGDQLAILGYSQGGHGALWAGQLAGQWTPEYELVGVVAGAPASELPVILQAAGSGPVAGFLYMILAGFNDAYPDEADLSAVLTPEGEAELAAVDHGCVREVIGHFAALDSSTLLKPAGLTSGPWAELAQANDPGNVTTDAPILILHSAADDIVPAALSELLFERLCGLGQVVERRVYDEGQGHVAAGAGAIRDGLAWLDQRLAGEEPVTTCPAG